MILFKRSWLLIQSDNSDILMAQKMKELNEGISNPSIATFAIHSIRILQWLSSKILIKMHPLSADRAINCVCKYRHCIYVGSSILYPDQLRVARCYNRYLSQKIKWGGQICVFKFLLFQEYWAQGSCQSPETNTSRPHIGDNKKSHGPTIWSLGLQYQHLEKYMALGPNIGNLNANELNMVIAALVQFIYSNGRPHFIPFSNLPNFQLGTSSCICAAFLVRFTQFQSDAAIFGLCLTQAAEPDSKFGLSIQGNSGPMVLHKCLALATCIRSKSN